MVPKYNFILHWAKQKFVYFVCTLMCKSKVSENVTSCLSAFGRIFRDVLTHRSLYQDILQAGHFPRVECVRINKK